jgi:mono/diheme cytochrome c family protein
MNPKKTWLAFSSLALLLSAFLIVAPAVSRVAFQQKRKPSTEPRDQQVAELFRNNCARCHGADGRGDTPLGNTYKAPDFTDSDWWKKHSDITGTTSLISIVNHGKGGMPAFGKKISRTDIRRLVEYVRKFRKQKPST